MIGAVVIGVFLIPALFVIIQGLVERARGRRTAEASGPAADAAG